MDQQASFITISTPDLDVVRKFYVDALGWTALLDVPGEVIFFRVGHGLLLSFYDAPHFAADLGDSNAPRFVDGLTLSQNLAGPDEVDATLKLAADAGGTILKPGQEAAFGGYHGHFADPVGVIWEVAFNPGWSVNDDGTVILAPPT